MFLGLTPEQEFLRNAAREFLARECPRETVRQIEASESGHSPDLWQALAGLGWLGLGIPEALGGADGQLVDLCLLNQELGRAVAPTPFLSTAVIAPGLLLALGSPDQQQEWLSRIAGGEAIVAWALTEPNASYDLDSIAVSATPLNDGGYSLDGLKLFVPSAQIADLLIVVARAPAGLGCFLVPRDATGLTVTPLKSVGGAERLNEVRLESVAVPAEAVLGEIGGVRAALEATLLRAKVAHGAGMVGGARMAQEMAVEYARTRVQFGQPIGSFQAIQHKLADVVTEVDGAELITYRAAQALAAGASPPAALLVAMAKTQANEAYRKATAEGEQVFGGYGFILDHDMQLYFRRAKADELTFGTVYQERAQVAAALGL